MKDVDESSMKLGLSKTRDEAERLAGFLTMAATNFIVHICVLKLNQ